jgi:hypothetical protein
MCWSGPANSVAVGYPRGFAARRPLNTSVRRHPMLIRYSNTFADALAFATVHNLRSIPLLTFILAVSMWIGWSSLPDDASGLVRVGTFVLMTLLFFIAILVFQLLFNAYWFAFNRDKNYLTDHQAELTESEFVESTTYTRVEIKWPGIFAVRAALGRL